MNPATPDVLLVFAREPVPGRVKTRLIPALGAERATLVYRRLLAHSLACVGATRADRKILFTDGNSDATVLRGLANRYGLATRPQVGLDLGARMFHAFRQSLADRCRVVLIGTDCPEYDPAYLADAFAALDEHDAVIGPAGDGGYVLLGLRRVASSLFDKVPWGGPRVMVETRRRLTRLGWSWVELTVRHDVDQPADLARFPSLLDAEPGSGQIPPTDSGESRAADR